MSAPRYVLRTRPVPPILSRCLLCGHEGELALWDKDLRGRLCAPCGEHAALSSRALQRWAAATVPAEPLIDTNP